MKKLSKTLIFLLLFSMVLVACRRGTEEEATPATEALEPTEEAMEEEATEAPEPTEEAMEEGTTEAPEPTEDAMEDKVIKVGFMGPLTGGAAFIGQEQLGFAQVFVDEFNERTGLNVEIVEGDTQLNADTGKIVAEQFAANPDVYVVIGPAASQVCEATQPVFEEAGLAHLTPSCTATHLTQPGTPTFFRPIPADNLQSAAVADYMLNTLKISSVYMVDDQSTYSVGLNDELGSLLQAAGITDIERASVPQEETDFSSVVTAIIAADSEIVFFPSQILAQESTLAVQLREQGYDGAYFLADGGFAPDVIDIAGTAAEGTYVSFFAPDPNYVPGMAPYNERYAAEYDEAFGAFGGAAGFTAWVTLEALEECVNNDDISRQCMIETLGSLQRDNSPLGVPISFGEGNQAEGQFFIFQIQDGQFVSLLEGDTGIEVETTEPDQLSFDGPIKLGFMGPLTLDAAAIGQEQLGFVKATVTLFNERTGLNVEIVEGDTELVNPDTGRIVAENFVADPNILVVVGPAASQVCEATQPIFEEGGLAQITPSCTRTDLTQPGTPTFFRPIPTDAVQSATVAEHMINELGVSSVYIVDDQSSYAVGLGDELTALLEEAGVTVDRASVTNQETDFSSIATGIIAAGSEVVFFPSQIEGQIGTFAAQLREQGFDGIYYLPDGGFAPNWVEAAGTAAEGTYVTFFAPDPNYIPTMAPYNEEYVAITAIEEFGAFGGGASFAAYIALDAIETCVRANDISRACVIDALTNINLETTPLGLPVSFGEGNQAEGNFSLFIIQDGQFVLLTGG